MPAVAVRHERRKKKSKDKRPKKLLLKPYDNRLKFLLRDTMEMITVEEAPLVSNPPQTIGTRNANDTNVQSNPKDTEGGKSKSIWVSRLFNFLKLLVFGLAVFVYDVYSKFLLQSMIRYLMPSICFEHLKKNNTNYY